MLVEANNLYEGWVRLNEEFAYIDPGRGMHLPSRDYTRVVWPVRMHVSNGFGFGEEHYDMLPPFYANYHKRIALLEKRYIDPELWSEGIARLKARERRFQKRNPLSFAIQFRRRATRERKVPAGGGCLQTITFVWCENRWALHVHLRASEITAALMGDLVFLEYVVRRVREEVRLKNWVDDFEIVWDISLASQMKAIVGLFLLYTGGDESVFKHMFTNPDKLNEWHRNVVLHFWNEFIFPERIVWHQRRRWSLKFIEASEIDWHIACTRWKKEFESCESIATS